MGTLPATELQREVLLGAGTGTLQPLLNGLQSGAVGRLLLTPWRPSSSGTWQLLLSGLTPFVHPTQIPLLGT